FLPEQGPAPFVQQSSPTPLRICACHTSWHSWVSPTYLVDAPSRQRASEVELYNTFGLPDSPRFNVIPTTSRTYFRSIPKGTSTTSSPKLLPLWPSTKCGLKHVLSPHLTRKTPGSTFGTLPHSEY
ncbi:unnamed protein product, partial [Prunus brigantina]